MMMSNESKLRNGFLATISMGIAAVTVYAIAVPHVGNRQVADFFFPDEIPLATWQQLSSESLATPAQPDENGELIESAKRYSYEKDNLSLVLDMRYLVGARGNMTSLLQDYYDISPEIMATQQVKEIPEIGSYLLVGEANSKGKEEKINYLSSCLTSVGDSIANQKEFSEVLNQVELTPRLIWDWFWGKNTLRDRRCLWVHLAISSQDGELDTSYEDFEQVWLELRHWWQPRFPKL